MTLLPRHGGQHSIMEGAYQHLATKADLYKALFLFALGQTALQVSVIVLILRVLR